MDQFDFLGHRIDKSELGSHRCSLLLVNGLTIVTSAVAVGIGLADANIFEFGLSIELPDDRFGCNPDYLRVRYAQLRSATVSVAIPLSVYQSVKFQMIISILAEGQQRMKGVVD